MKKMTVQIVSILLLLPGIAFAACPAPEGTVYTAVNATLAEVESCIDAANGAAGGTVNIPAGSATWAGTITKSLTQNIAIVGAGDTTVITSGSAGRLFSLEVTTTKTVSLASMKIVAGANTYTNGLIGMYGASPNKSIKSMTFDNSGWTGGRTITFIGYGTIAASTFTMPNVGQGMQIYGTTDAGDYNYWSGTPNFGTANATFIEGNTFTYASGEGDGAFDAYGGAKVVFRYNTVNGSNVGWHGNDSSSGLHSAEIYRNVFTDDSNWTSATVHARGGTALIWGNTFGANMPTAITLSSYRSCPRDASEDGVDNQRCDNTGEGGAAHDANTDATGYRCYQQVGATGNDGVTQWPIIEWDNNFGAGTNNGGFWLNTTFIKPANGGVSETCTNYDMTDHVKAGRDYVDHDTCVGVTSDFCTAWWDDVNKKGKLNGSAYTPSACPHATTGLTGTCTSEVGTTGYNVATAHTVTSSKTGTGTLSYEGEYVVTDGADSPTYTATIPNGWKVTWSGTGGCTGNGTTCQVLNVTGDVTVVATFSEIKLMPW